MVQSRLKSRLTHSASHAVKWSLQRTGAPGRTGKKHQVLGNMPLLPEQVDCGYSWHNVWMTQPPTMMITVA